LTDGQLLDNFIDHREEAAVAALVRRHGPMVLGPIKKREPVSIVRGEPPKGTVFFVFFFWAFPKQFPS
jgi:hypothetical protein